MNEEWFRTYTGGFDPNLLNDFTIDSSGNSYLVGDVSLNPSESRSAFGTVKYNSGGKLQWANLFTGSQMGLSYAEAVVIDNTGNVYVTGTTYDTDSSENYCTIKFHSDGEIEWVRKFQAFPGSRDFATDLCMDNNGYIYVTGYTYGLDSEFINTVKYDPTGEIIWVAGNLNGNKNLRTKFVAADNSGNVFISGYLSGKICTVKYNSSGHQQWVSFFDNPDLNDVTTDLKLDENGNVYVLSRNFEGGFFDDYYTSLVKYDNSGNEIWHYRTDSTGYFDNYYKITMSFQIDQTGNVYFATCYNRGISLIKLNSNGDELWNAKYKDYPTYYNIHGNAVEIDKEGSIYVNGSASKPPQSEEFITLKFDSDGILKWIRYARSNKPSGDESAFINVDNSGNVYVAGIAYNFFIELSFGVVKYSQSVGITNISNEIPSAFNLYQNYPNPFNPVTKIQYEIPASGFVELKVYDVLGKEVITLVNEDQNAGKYETEFGGADLPGGLYFFKLTSGNYSQTKKMLLVK
ncbi:MAG: SBBP repeat-containing protein [Ignavibacteria bacterium]